MVWGFIPLAEKADLVKPIQTSPEGCGASQENNIVASDRVALLTMAPQSQHMAGILRDIASELLQVSTMAL